MDSVIIGDVTCETRFTRGRNDQQRRRNFGDLSHLFKWSNDNILVHDYSKKNRLADWKNVQKSIR